MFERLDSRSLRLSGGQFAVEVYNRARSRKILNDSSEHLLRDHFVLTSWICWVVYFEARDIGRMAAETIPEKQVVPAESISLPILVSHILAFYGYGRSNIYCFVGNGHNGSRFLKQP